MRFSSLIATNYSYCTVLNRSTVMYMVNLLLNTYIILYTPFCIHILKALDSLWQLLEEWSSMESIGIHPSFASTPIIQAKELLVCLKKSVPRYALLGMQPFLHAVLRHSE